MSKLTVYLIRITGLSDNDRGDRADPYVKFELEQDNIGFRRDKDYGEMVSSKKTDQHNPTYNETFVFEDIPTLNNMELKVKVMVSE